MSLIFVVEAGEMLHVAEAFLDKSYHPTVICRGKMLLVFYEIKDTFYYYYCGLSLVFVHDYAFIWSAAAYNKALEDAIAVLDRIAMPIDVKDRKFLESWFIAGVTYWMQPNTVCVLRVMLVTGFGKVETSK